MSAYAPHRNTEEERHDPTVRIGEYQCPSCKWIYNDAFVYCSHCQYRSVDHVIETRNSSGTLLSTTTDEYENAKDTLSDITRQLSSQVDTELPKLDEQEMAALGFEHKYASPCQENYGSLGMVLLFIALPISISYAPGGDVLVYLYCPFGFVMLYTYLRWLWYVSARGGFSQRKNSCNAKYGFYERGDKWKTWFCCFRCLPCLSQKSDEERRPLQRAQQQQEEEEDEWDGVTLEVRRDQESPIRTCEYCRLYCATGFVIFIAVGYVFFALLIVNSSPDTDAS